MPNRTLLMIAGVLSLIVGVYALFNPAIASFTVEQITGWAFLLLGVLQIIAGVRAQNWSGRIWALLLGAVGVNIGASLLSNPLEGLITLTVLLGIMFLISGVFKLIVGRRVTDAAQKSAIMVSGAVSLLLSLMILANIPASAVAALGILLGVELISNGVSIICFALISDESEKT